MDDFGIAALLRYYIHIVTLLAGAAIIIAVSEKAFGLNIRGVIDNIEKAADDGNVWPGAVLLSTGVLVLAYVLG